MRVADRVRTIAAAVYRYHRRTHQCLGLEVSTGEQCTGWAIQGDHLCSTHVARRHHLPAASLTAAVAQVDMGSVGWQTWRLGSRAWQTEAWRLYDITGALRFVAGWVGNSVSRCRLYVAEVDDTGEAGEETDDPDLAALAAGPLGQGPAKDEALRLAAINLFIPGECYIVAEADAGPGGEDVWFVVSGQQIRRVGDRIVIRRSLLHGGGDMEYRDGVDLILRVHTPHPANTDEPDSPTRSAIPELREIEAIRKRQFAELDSRLIGAGLLPLPQGMDFPRGPSDPAGLPGFSALLGRTMGTSLSDRGSAEATVPILVTVPPDALDKIKPVTFWSDLSDQLLPMKTAAFVSLAQSLDVPAEILLGQGDSNHWSAWQISEDAISTQIVPILSRIADALTTGYLRGALEELGYDPDAYVYHFDTSPLTVRPNRSADALSYHGAGLLSDEAALEAGAFRPDQAPDLEERLRRLAVAIVEQDPSMLNDPTIRELVGITTPPPSPPPAAGTGEVPGGGEAPAAPPPVQEPRALPQQTPQTQNSAAITAGAGAALRRALSLAGGRLVPHNQRDRYGQVPRYQLHTHHGPVTPDRASDVLRGAWDDLPELAADLNLDPVALEATLHGHAVDLLTRGMAYDPALLRDVVGLCPSPLAVAA